MIAVDTSAWVDLLRNRDSQARRTLERELRADADLVLTEVVVGELLAGARTEIERHRLRSRLLAFPILPLGGLQGFIAAADLYRSARQQGVTIRKYTDCLVAVPVIAAGAELLHADRDFDQLATVTPLRIMTLHD